MPPRIRNFGSKPPQPPDFDASDVTSHLADHEQPASPTFVPVKGLTDLDSLPRRFDLLESKMDDGFEMLGDKLLPALERLEATMARMSDREQVRDALVVEHSHALADLTQMVDRINQHLGLEPRPLPPLSSLPPRPKRPTLKR
jgi:hypothetical protein